MEDNIAHSIFNLEILVVSILGQLLVKVLKVFGCGCHTSNFIKGNKNYKSSLIDYLVLLSLLFLIVVIVPAF